MSVLHKLDVLHGARGSREAFWRVKNVKNVTPKSPKLYSIINKVIHSSSFFTFFTAPRFSPPNRPMGDHA
jgi:hypothetical protein